MLVAKLGADLNRRFSYNLDSVKQRESQHFIFVEILAASTFGEPDSGT
jgi:hypothetical protein